MTSSTKDIPPNERIEYVNAVWLLENEADGTYASFGERIGRSRQEVNRFLRPDPTYGISRRMAMRIEGGFNKPQGWLSQDHGYPQPRENNQERAGNERNHGLTGYSNDVFLSRFDTNAILKWGVSKTCEKSIKDSFDTDSQGIASRLTITPVSYISEDPILNALADSRSLFKMGLGTQESVVAIERIALEQHTDMSRIKKAFAEDSFFCWHPDIIANGVVDMLIEFSIKDHAPRYLLCRKNDPKTLVDKLVDNCDTAELFLEECAAHTNDVLTNWFNETR